MIPDDAKIEGIGMVDEKHIILRFSDGRTLKFSLEQIKTILPVAADFTTKEG